jgi:uncharacterized protein (TIGR02271 family)
MAMNARQTVVGVFDEPAMADRAVDALQNAGFDAGQIHYAGHGATTGTSGGGFFEGLRRFFTGDDLTGNDNNTEDFSQMGLRDDEARWYNDQYNAGHAVVTVRTADRVDEAKQILQTNGAYNYDMRSGSNVSGATTTNAANAGTYTQTTDYAQSQPADYAATQTTNTYQQPADYTTTQTTNTYQQPADYATTNTANTAANDVNTDQERSLRLREEQLQANKERVQAGEVTLHKDVVEEQKTLNVPVTHEEVYVERRDANVGQVDNAPIGQDEMISVPVSEEQVNVTKQAVVTGEVSVGKRAVTENQQVSDTVQREEARVVRQGDVNVQGSGANLVDRTANTVENAGDTLTNRTVDDTTSTDTDTRNPL